MLNILPQSTAVNNETTPRTGEKRGCMMNQVTDTRPFPANDPGTSRCAGCLFYTYEEESGRDHCFRFVRFVDHVIHESTEDCDYRHPAGKR